MELVSALAPTNRALLLLQIELRISQLSFSGTSFEHALIVDTGVTTHRVVELKNCNKEKKTILETCMFV